MQVNMTWEQKRYASFIFPQVVQCDGIDVRRIHPLKQREACRIYEEFADNSDVESIYLFGSSVNIRCHIHSDTDVAVLLARDSLETRGYVSGKIQELCDWNADVVWLNSEQTDSRLYRDILRGVRLK